MLTTAQIKHSLLNELMHLNKSMDVSDSDNEINFIYQLGLKTPSNSDEQSNKNTNNNNNNNEINNTLWQVLNNRDSYIEANNLIRCQMEGQTNKSSYRTLFKRLSLRQVTKGWCYSKEIVN